MSTQLLVVVIVVDDHVSFLRSVGRLLCSAGYAVATFGTSRELLAAICGVAPHCLLIDVHMPEMNGFELQAQLAAQGLIRPAIFMTAYDTPQIHERARHAGNSRLLVKPFDRRELLDAITEAIGRSSLGLPSQDKEML